MKGLIAGWLVLTVVMTPGLAQRVVHDWQAKSFTALGALLCVLIGRRAVIIHGGVIYRR